ncbi:hypothetical protein AB0I22_22545 [Streptomyces sp. NPDC050610]|uniref:hypothetical protein n=1 Tax=Streptomyces sp. NPDC050610 TaxID=3157097 RepID=UPI003434CFB0
MTTTTPPAAGSAHPWLVPLGLPPDTEGSPAVEPVVPAVPVIPALPDGPAAPAGTPVPDGTDTSDGTDVRAEAPAASESGVRRRYIEDILRLHSRLSFGGLAGRLHRTDSYVYRAAHGKGVITTAAPTSAIPERYLLGLAGFRLSEYLRAGYASEDIVFDNSLFCEPVQGIHESDIHVITTDQETGRILGYVSLAHSEDHAPRPLDAPDRRLFPCEQAHNLRLLSLLKPYDGLTTHSVREVKRFVQAHSLTDRTMRLRVMLGLLAGISGILCQERHTTRMLIGDVEKHVALRHLVLLGLDVHLLDGTTPRLGLKELMHPMYVTREKVYPFLAHLPSSEETVRRTAVVQRAAAADAPFKAVRDLLSELSGSVQHIEVAA